MPKIAQELLAERRAQIVEAAMRAFAAKGLAKVTLRDVFRETGMSAGAVYNYFQSKDDLVLAITQAGMSEALAVFGSEEAGASRLEDVVDLFFATLERIAGTHVPRVDLMIVTEALSNPDVQRSVLQNRAAVKAALTRSVQRRQQESPEWQGHSAAVLAEILYMTYQGLVMSLALGERVDVTGVRQALKAMRFG